MASPRAEHRGVTTADMACAAVELLTFKQGSFLHQNFKPKLKIWTEKNNKEMKQAEAKLDLAQFKLGLDFTLIFCIFGFSRFGSIILVGLI